MDFLIIAIIIWVSFGLGVLVAPRSELPHKLGQIPKKLKKNKSYAVSEPTIAEEQINSKELNIIKKLLKK